MRTALRQIDCLDLWLQMNLPADQKVVFESLMTLDNWRRAVRTPARPNVDPARALIELTRAAEQAQAILDRLGKPHHHRQEARHG
jgi:hypothetical protein